MPLKEQIFAAQDRVVAGPIEIDEWDCSVWIRPLDLGERLALQQRLKDVPAKDKDRGVPEAILVAFAVQDQDGALIFDKDDPHDVEALAAKSPAILNWLALEVMSHNRIGDRPIEAARKNSKSARSSILPFRSPGHSSGSLREICELDPAEFVTWMAWCQLHGPIGPERQDLQAALVCSEVSVVAGAWGGKVRSPDEIMPDWRNARRCRTPGRERPGRPPTSPAPPASATGPRRWPPSPRPTRPRGSHERHVERLVDLLAALAADRFRAAGIEGQGATFVRFFVGAFCVWLTLHFVFRWFR